MKTIRFCAIFLIIASFSAASLRAAEWETFEVINRLLVIPGPSMPVVHENWVIFTADSALRRVGVAFAHENFANIRWFRPLVVPQEFENPIVLPNEREPRPYRDSGKQFYLFQIPGNLRELEYRLVINGLWTLDPNNPYSRRDPVSGLTMSILPLPPRTIRPNPLHGLPEGLLFTFRAPPGEIVTVAGNFNGWDPFMFEMREGPAGVYSLLLPLPPGTYQYVFFHRGRRFTDPYNPNRIYARDGSSASVIVVP